MRPQLSCRDLIGRAEEFATLSGAFARATDGQPSIVLVGGEAGVGKTRLVSELASSVRRGGDRVWIGHCLPHGDYATPFAPIVEVLHEATATLGEQAVRTLARRAAGVLPALVPATGDAPADPRLVVDGQMRVRQWAEIRLLLERMTDEPTLIVLEDLHWADAATCGLLDLMARGMQGRLLLAGTYRDDELPVTHPFRSVLVELARAGVTRMTVNRFDLAETSAQIAGISGEEPAAADARRVFERSGGNPFLVEELLALGPNDDTLSESLRDILLLRFHPLPGAARSVVRAVAVARRAVEHALLSDVLGLPAEELNAALDVAVRQHILVTEERCYLFRHALVAEAVVADTLPGERLWLHRALGEAFSARLARGGPTTPARAALLAEAAWHWFAAGDADRALVTTVDAALAAERTYALPEAYGLFRRALDLWWEASAGRSESSVDLVDLHQHAAQAAYAMGDTETALTLIQQGLDEADHRQDPLRAGMLYRWQGRFMLGAGRPVALTLRAIENATRLVPDAPTRERAEVLAAQAGMNLVASRFGDAIDLARAAAALARQAGARVEEANALGTLGSCLALLGDAEEGMTHLRIALSTALEADDRYCVWRTYLNLSDVLCYGGSFAEGADVAFAGLAVFQDGSLSREEYDSLLGNALEPLFWLGRWDEMAKHLAERGDPDTDLLLSGNLWLAAAALCTARGDFAGAARHLDRCRSARTGAHVELGGQMLACQAELHLWQRRPEAALASATQGLTTLADSDHHGLVARLLAAAARACSDLTLTGRAAGPPKTVSELITRIAVLRRTGRLPGLAGAHLDIADGELARAGGAGSAGGVGEVSEAWGRAAAGWHRLEAPYPAAYARWRQAEALLSRPGLRRVATGALAEAFDTAVALGAEPLRREIDLLARRARLNLPSTRSDPARPLVAPEQHAAFGLTAREEEVLVRVARGDTNREIARGLFISDKTVSVHVSRILAKMGVPNRATAAATAHRLGLAEPP